MSLDARVWTALEQHGLSQSHLEMLLSLLETQRNGSVSWHVVAGRLSQCDLRLVFPSREYEVARVSDVLLDGNGLVR